MSIRQLRDLARNLGIRRYAASDRVELSEAISSALPEGEQIANLAAIEAEMAPAPRPAAHTRVVFLPRDPQWAYVFWEIAEIDRSAALAA
ncbi:MAG: DUF4912 domain-containing protein, partial [Cyanobium sp.]